MAGWVGSALGLVRFGVVPARLRAVAVRIRAVDGAECRNQSPVPAAAVIPSRTAASNCGGQGPCPATTYGETCSSSNVAGSVAHAIAQASTSAERRSQASRFLKI